MLFLFVNEPGGNGIDALQLRNTFALFRRFDLGGQDAGAFGSGGYLLRIKKGIPGRIAPGLFLLTLAHLQ